MKANIVPLFFDTEYDPDFQRQVQALRELLVDEAVLLPPVALGAPLPDADGVVFPQMLGAAYRRWEQIVALPLPILVATSEFGTVSMWDWEINAYLRSHGKSVLAPYNLEQTKVICRALALKRELRQAKFLVYQDNPGQGFQPEIFKRFYWWEDECTQRILDKFGIQIVKRSFKELGERARGIADGATEETWERWKDRLEMERLSLHQIRSALKLYLAIQQA
jgi:hypothetical protein